MTVRITRPLLLATAGAATIALTATACGNSNDAAEPAPGQVSVVASTNVWGNLAQTIGGDKVFVKSIIDDPSGDPHSYESSPADSAAVNDARLVIYNGGGYDEFFNGLAEQAPDAKRVVAAEQAAVEDGESGHEGAEHGGAGHGSGDHGEEGHGEQGHDEHGHGEQERGGHGSEAHSQHGHGEQAQGEQGHDEHSHGEQGHGEQGHDEHSHGEQGQGEHGHQHGAVNEHYWYHLPTVQKVVHKIADQLAAIQPESQDRFRRNAERLAGQLDDLQAKTEKIGEGKPGAKVLATEPVSHYMLQAAGLEDATPQKYVQAVENENDVPPATIAEVNKLVSGKKIAAVLENKQTETPTTADIVQRARDSGIPVVGVTETLPRGSGGYVDWMSKQVDALSRALSTK